MINKNDYFQERKLNTLEKTDKILQSLPRFVSEYFLGIDGQTSPLTKYNYAIDIEMFLDFISQKYDVAVLDMKIGILDEIKAIDIEQFLSYLTSFDYKGQHHFCNEKAKARKLASIRSMFRYFFDHDQIIANTASKVKTPKLHEKEIIRLDGKEVTEIIDVAETGEGFSKRQLAYQKNTSVRDVALLTLFLGTGIRISELVGLNTDDIFLDNNSFIITRKGGNRAILYFTDEVKEELTRWLEFREHIKDLDKNEKALFLSLRNKRISTRAVENLVQKYAKIVTPLKHITPHKLRSTFGTNLYMETRDIYVVAKYLGHKDINTTKRHYAAMNEDVLKDAVEKISLKNDDIADN